MHDAVGAAHGVVPVAADLEPDAARVVAPGELDALDLGERLGQQAALERDRDLVLAFERRGAVERRRRLLGVRRDQPLLAVAQRVVSANRSHNAPTRLPSRFTSGVA